MTTQTMTRISQTVVTYQNAYLPGEHIDLCARHAATDHDPIVRRIFGSLGPVSHGAHAGRCEACRVELGDEPHRHHAVREEDRGYTGTVNDYDENPAAHGNIMRIEYCACGAERRTNINFGQTERGTWRTS